MSEQELLSLLDRIKSDHELREKFKSAASIDDAVKIANKAGFNLRRADLIRHHAQQILELSDNELENISGGTDILTLVICLTLFVCPRKDTYQCIDNNQITDSVT